MREVSDFECVGYIGASPTGSGLLYPLFRTQRANVNFVQEVGRAGEITSFIPFYDDEQFRFYNSDGTIKKIIGEKSIYAYFVGDILNELDYDEIAKEVRVGSLIFDESLPSLTRLSLARLGQAPQAEQLKLLRTFNDARHLSRLSTKVSLAAHTRTASERDRWWDAIDAREPQNDGSNENRFRKFETEDLFQTLYENPCSGDWTIGLKTLMSRVLYDDRLFDLVAKMLNSEEFCLSVATKRERAIVGRGLELFCAVSSFQNDFADMMQEYVISGEIFTLASVVPPAVIIKFIDTLEEMSRLDGLAIDYYMDELRSDTISPDLAYALANRIEASESLGQTYGEKSYYEGLSRREVFKHIIKTHGRLGLVLDHKMRRRIARM